MKFLIDNYTNNQTITETKVKTWHSGILTQSQSQVKCDYQSRVREKLKVNNKDTRATSMITLWCVHYKPKALNTTHPSNTATDSEQVNVRWYVSC